ncbi:hypothetical protein [Microvirga sesbaniae]|uniref:hypothetical protein n=1 Tax=Microvirga sesbaniae TaxID=681392 RepID=UPI0021C63EDB|nr:hypothetical protein [Microvirga sp. HBU67692]
MAQVPSPASASPDPSLLAAPVTLTGNWGASAEAAAQVVARMREACLSGIPLRSDSQPRSLLVDNRSASGATSPPAQPPAEQPSVHLHADRPQMAWIVVTAGERDWSRLSYQFGHELGHVFCNSWQAFAKPQLPSQWVEEALVEAFSIRGLGLLADGWERKAPFAGQEPFAGKIRQYRDNLVAKYGKRAAELGAQDDLAAFFRTHRKALDSDLGVAPKTAGAVSGFLAELERDSSLVADLGALNRWPERSAVPVERYLDQWEASCSEVGTSGLLPGRIRGLLKLG